MWISGCQSPKAMISFDSIEQARATGAETILLDPRTRLFWRADNPVEARAALRLGMVHAQDWETQINLTEMSIQEAALPVYVLPETQAHAPAWAIWLVVVVCFFVNLAIGYGLALWKRR